VALDVFLRPRDGGEGGGRAIVFGRIRGFECCCERLGAVFRCLVLRLLFLDLRLRLRQPQPRLGGNFIHLCCAHRRNVICTATRLNTVRRKSNALYKGANVHQNIHRVIDVPLDLIEHNAFRLMPVKRRKEKSKRSFRANSAVCMLKVESTNHVVEMSLFLSD